MIRYSDSSVVAVYWVDGGSIGPRGSARLRVRLVMVGAVGKDVKLRIVEER